MTSRSWLVLASLVVLVVLVAGCSSVDSIDYGQETAIMVTVTDVRVSTASKVYSKGGNNAVIGAIVGGIVAKTEGAIVGTALGADSSNAVINEVKEEITGCRVVFQSEHGLKIVFTFSSAGLEARECSLLSPGDQKHIAKVGKEPRVFYVWNVEDPNWTSGEVFALGF